MFGNAANQVSGAPFGNNPVAGCGGEGEKLLEYYQYGQPHQAHDFENLLDHLVILGKGEILLNRSLDEISNRLLFARTDILPAESIYSEQDLSGHFSILPNEDGEENTPDIELLYKAVLQQPEKIQSMFQ